MRVLILSCGTGGGHNAAGRAMREELEAAGHQAEMLCYMELAGKKVAGAVDQSYINLVKRAPRAFGFLYRAGILVSSAKRHSPVYYANAAMAGRLGAYLKEHPADFLVATHLYAAETLTYMKKHTELPPNLAIATDYTCIPFWEETDCDAYILPHPELTAEYTARGMKPERLYPLGIPVSRSFQNIEEKREDKALREEVFGELGIAPNRRLILLMGGSMGFGRLAPLAERIYGQQREGETLLVVCGSNRRMEEKLLEQFQEKPHIRIIGRTDRAADLMAVSALVYTKPGGLTSTEAAAARCPLVHTDPIPGCETRNRSFFLEHGMSLSGDTLEEQAACGRALLEDERLRRGMRLAQEENLDAFASRRIVRWMEERVRQ